jgi:hypothetical protein
MGAIFDLIREAIRDERYIISWHADERCEERGVTDWQLVAGFEAAKLLHERPATKPHPSVIVRQNLADGSEVEVVWALMPQSRRAKLVTVYFTD